LTSSDEIINPDDFQRYNTEYLNSLSPSGLLTHRLFIKPGMPVMLMRNLNPKMGLCIGTRLIFQKIHKNHLLECKIVGGEHGNRTVLIPRITLRPKDREFPFEWGLVGVWLNDPCFAHGKLYVAMSRVGSPRDIKFAIRKQVGYTGNLTSNVVIRRSW
jgi:hypothetical protein